MTELSVVISTYNRARVLPDLLAAFEEQTERDFEIVVAIDGSTDDTEAVLAGLSHSFPLRWVNTHCAGYGLAVARNLGILAAKGRAVVILDDDSFPGPGFVAAHCAGARPHVITGGPRHPSTSGDARMTWKMEQLSRLPPMTPLTIQDLKQTWPNAYLIENNICLLRDDWITMGLFSERLKVYGYIGQEFFGRAEYLGLRYQFNPAATVIHRGELEGDNGFRRSRKNRQIKLATLVRPSLMTPVHYRAQIAWAKASAEGRDLPKMPPYRSKAALAAPYRLLRQGLSGTKRRAKALMRSVQT
jgi:glycosyltransferase involved in cell wall biosynthesis